MKTLTIIFGLLISGCCFDDSIPCKVILVDKRIQQTFLSRDCILTFVNIDNNERYEVGYSDYAYNNVQVGDTLNAECNCGKPMTIEVIVKKG